MAQFLQVLLSGLSTGSIYALAAIGFVLVWQTAQTVNFAQGEFVMLPAFFVLAGVHILGLPLFAALIMGIVISIFILGFVFMRMIVEPMGKNPGLTLIISTMAVSIFLKEGVKQFYAAEAQPFPSLLPQTVFSFGGAVFSIQDISILIVSLAIVIALTLFLDHTKIGRSMQATAQNPNVAEILGINIKRMTLFAFIINATLSSLASILISPIYLAKFSSGENLGLVAFIAAIVGGLNQIRGALAGGLLIGVLDNLTATYITAQYRAAIPLVLLVIIILFRPEGLLGTSEGRKV